MKTKRRLLSLLMAGVVLFSTMPVNALAVGNSDPGGPCEHHREHTAECGYTKGEEGSLCTHEHTEDCGFIPVVEDGDGSLNVSGNLGAGIGGANGDDSNPTGDGGTITMNGGSVTAIGGNDEYVPASIPGIGGAYRDDRTGNNGSLTLSSADVLVDTALGPNGTYTINGAPTADMIVVPEGLVYSGEPLELDGEIYIDDIKTGTAEYFGQTFTVKASKDGWVLQDLGEVKEAKEYTATFTNGEKTISKKFTVAQSGTQFEGNLIVRNGATVTTAFTVSDTITVIATPKATGQVPANGAMLAADLATPTRGQMALYVGDRQVSRAVDAIDGSYTLTANPADVLAAAQAEPNGNAITLTVQFIGNDNMANATGQVNVTITAVAKVENGGAVTYTGSLEDAFAKASSGATVTMLADVVLMATVYVSNTLTLDLNGYTISGQNIYAEGNLTIQDNSEAGGGTVKQVDAESELTIHGGTYNIIIIPNSSGFEKILAKDHAYYGTEGNPIALDELKIGNSGWGDSLQLTGPVTVKPCTHQGAKATHNENSNPSTHTITCPYCGKTEAAENCISDDWTRVDETNHQRTCKLCKYVETEAHTLALSARSEGFTIIVTAKCSACGYAAEYSRGTITNLGNLVYGQSVPGIQFTHQSGVEPYIITYYVDDDQEETSALPVDLSAGDHTLHAALAFGEPNSSIEINSVDIPFTVKKKPLAVSGAAAAGRAYNGTNTVTITGVTLSGKVKDTDDVSVDTSNLTGTINGTDAGDYTSVTLPAMTLTGAAKGNYNLTHPTGAVSTSVEITKATAPAAQDGKMFVSIDLKHTYSYTLDQLLPVLTGGQTFGTVAYTMGTVSLGDYYTDGAAITGNKLSLPVNAVQSDKEEVVGTIPITISSKNFQDITAEITVSSIKQIVPEGTPTAFPSTITYGQPISSITISGQMHGGADPVEGKFEWDSPNVIPDAGKYQVPWTFKPDNSELYTEVTGYITITVQKATPSLTLTPSSATMPGGTVTLILSGLPAGGSATVTCSNETISVTKGSGDTWTAELPAGGGSYTFTASYAGDGNHTGATANCTVSVEKIKPTLVLSVSPKSLNGGGEVMLTLTGLPDKGEATVSCSDSSITVTRSGENWKASLPNKTAEYTFIANYSGDAQHTSAEATCTVSVTRHTSSGNGGSSGGNTGGNTGGDSGSNSGGGSTGSGSGGSTITTRPNEKYPDIPTTSETKPVKPDKDGNVSIGGDPIQDAINKATTDANKNGNKENGIAVTVPVDHATDAESLAVTILAGTLDKLTAAKVRRLDITTNGLPCFSFTLDTLKMFDSLPDGGNIILRLSKTTALSKQAKEAIGIRPVYDFSFVFVKDGKETPITDWKGQTVSVRMPYTPAKDEQAGNIYAVYVDTNGKVEWLTKSSYDADQKALIFEASHFSIYGVGYKNPAPVFTDITGHWAADNIIFAASRGLLTDTGNNQFSPDISMTRGMFVTALGRLADIDPESYKTGKFTDVKMDAYYAPYVNWATEKGIMNSTSAATFSPDVGITREQMAVILANYAKKMGYDLPVAHEAVTFADKAQISSWAEKEVKAMQQAGIMAGKNGNRFDPKGPATRAEVAIVLRRFVEVIIDSRTAQGWMQDHSGFWQYMKDGKAITSWLYDDKKWYWLDQNGKMFAGGFKMIDSKWYYFYSDGMMAANTIIDGYTIGPDGARE